MTVLLLITWGLTSLYESEEEKKDKTFADGKASDDEKEQHQLLSKYHSFRFKYVSVYSVIMLADWMQGTHMYTRKYHSDQTATHYHHHRKYPSFHCLRQGTVNPTVHFFSLRACHHCMLYF